MSGEIVDRLRDFHRRYKSDGNITMLRATGLAQEAADEIEALRADWPLYEFLRTQAAADRERADNAAAVIDALLNRQRTARIEAEQWLDGWREARGQ